MESWRRNFHAVWPSLFATSMGLMAFLPVLAVYVKERFQFADERELNQWSAMIYGAAPLAAAIAGPVWGALGDRRGKKPMAIRANLAIAATTALMPFASTPLLLLVMRAIQGVLAGYVAPAMALVAQDAPRERHGLVIARLQVAMAFGSFVGPMLAPEVTLWWGRRALFWVTSVFAALGALQLACFAREAPPQRSRDGTPFLREMWRGSTALVTHRVFGWLLLLVLLLRLGQNMLEPFIALFVQELGAQRWIAAFSASPQHALDRTVAVSPTVMAIAQWVFTPQWGRLSDRFGPLRCLSLLGFGLSIAFTATAFVASIDQFLLLRTFAACFMAGSMTLVYAAASKRVGDAQRTLAFSMVQSCMQLGFGLGPQLGCMFASLGGGDRVEYRYAFVAAAALCLVAAIGMLALRHASRLHAAAARTAPVTDTESASPPPPAT